MEKICRKYKCSIFGSDAVISKKIQCTDQVVGTKNHLYTSGTS